MTHSHTPSEKPQGFSTLPLTAIDTIKFIESLQSSAEILDRHGRPIIAEIERRYEDVQNRIGNTQDISELKKLHDGLTFLRSISEHIELQNKHQQYVTRTFSVMDDTYWAVAINGQHLLDENRFMKETIRVLQNCKSPKMPEERQQWMRDRLVKKYRI